MERFRWIPLYCYRLLFMAKTKSPAQSIICVQICLSSDVFRQCQSNYLISGFHFMSQEQPYSLSVSSIYTYLQCMYFCIPIISFYSLLLLSRTRLDLLSLVPWSLEDVPGGCYLQHCTSSIVGLYTHRAWQTIFLFL